MAEWHELMHRVGFYFFYLCTKGFLKIIDLAEKAVKKCIEQMERC